VKPYPKYKSSGVPWLGDVPENWDVKRLKFLTDNVSEKTAAAAPGIRYVGLEHIRSWSGQFVEDSGDLQTESESTVCQFESGDVLFCKLRPYLAKAVIADTDGVGTTELLVLRPKLLTAGYLLRALLMESFIQQVSASTYGAKMPRADWTFISNLPLPEPSITEQSAIAAYLDTETARIDTLVAEKEKLIGLLSEARMSTITRLIVGADLPGVPSGNPWVPHLPRGWQLKRLKHLADVRSGLAKGKDYGGKPTVKMPYLRVANVQDGHLNLTEVLTIEVAADEAERFLLQSGDVLMNEGGDYDKLGRGAVWSGEVTPCLHQNHVFAVRPYEEDVSEWLAATTQTRHAKFYFKSNAKQSTNLASINQTNVKELPVLLPPPKERQQLLSQLRTEVLKIDGLISHVEKEIELLRELRSATITDAVLGRIDLRDYTKKNKRGDKARELQPTL